MNWEALLVALYNSILQYCLCNAANSQFVGLTRMSPFTIIKKIALYVHVLVHETLTLVSHTFRSWRWWLLSSSRHGCSLRLSALAGCSQLLLVSP